jgi:hypothetical protein
MRKGGRIRGRVSRARPILKHWTPCYRETAANFLRFRRFSRKTVSKTTANPVACRTPPENSLHDGTGNQFERNRECIRAKQGMYSPQQGIRRQSPDASDSHRMEPPPRARGSGSTPRALAAAPSTRGETRLACMGALCLVGPILQLHRVSIGNSQMPTLGGGCVYRGNHSYWPASAFLQ